MKVLVSACLLGENCKYNGGNNKSEKLSAFLKDKTVVAVCPEVLGGLPTPRTPSEIVNGTVFTRDGENVHAAFCAGAQKALQIAENEQVELAILQSRSPSCGAKQIYDGTFSGRKIEGQGIFAKCLSDAGIPVVDIEDL